MAVDWTPALSHFELRTQDVGRMADFYTRVLGFVVTDRGGIPDAEMVFLSRHPDEHHQIVLSATAERDLGRATVDHLAFRVAVLADVRAVHAALACEPGAEVEAVSHGTTWSVYFRDPDGNRLEVFADTPWHVDQPLRFPIDLSLSDEQLIRFTADRVRVAPGFTEVGAWRSGLADRLDRATKIQDGT